MVIDKAPIIQTKQEVVRVTNECKSKSDISTNEVQSLLHILQNFNDELETRGAGADRQALALLLEEVSNLTNELKNIKSNQERVASLLATLVRTKTNIENNIKEEKLVRKVESANKGKHA